MMMKKAITTMMNASTRCACIVALIASVAVTACTHPSAVPSNRLEASTSLHIELLGFPDCPNTPLMRVNLVSALTLEEKASFHEVNQEALDANDLRRGWPTPTVLVNGRDLFGMPAPLSATMGCRIYLGGVPTVSQLRSALESTRVKQ